VCVFVLPESQRPRPARDALLALHPLKLAWHCCVRKVELSGNKSTNTLCTFSYLVPQP
jgi:hypothetical protein